MKWSGNLWLLDHVYILYISCLLLCVLFLIVHILIQLGACIHDCVLCVLCIYMSACVCACFCAYWCIHVCVGVCPGMWTVLCSLSEILASTSPHVEERHAKKHIRLSYWCVVVWLTRSNGNNCVHNVTLSITVVCTQVSTIVHPTLCSIPHLALYFKVSCVVLVDSFRQLLTDAVCWWRPAQHFFICSTWPIKILVGSGGS